MRLIAILTVLSLALIPAALPAAEAANGADQGQSGTTVKRDGRPISGPLAGRPLQHSEIPVGAVVVGSLVLLGGVLIGILATGGGGDSNNSTNN